MLILPPKGLAGGRVPWTLKVEKGGSFTSRKSNVPKQYHGRQPESPPATDPQVILDVDPVEQVSTEEVTARPLGEDDALDAVAMVTLLRVDGNSVHFWLHDAAAGAASMVPFLPQMAMVCLMLRVLCGLLCQVERTRFSLGARRPLFKAISWTWRRVRANAGWRTSVRFSPAVHAALKKYADLRGISLDAAVCLLTIRGLECEGFPPVGRRREGVTTAGKVVDPRPSQRRAGSAAARHGTTRGSRGGSPASSSPQTDACRRSRSVAKEREGGGER